MIVLFTYGISITGFSQEDNEKNEIKVIARVQTDKVLLRWAATTPSSWLRGNKYGYLIERYTVLRDGNLLNPPEKKSLATAIPMPLEQWKEAVEKNDYAAIMAQALYGETFEVEETQGGLAQIINKSREIEQRFSFALFAADLNFEASKMAALGYEDVDIKNNEEYLYKVISLVPEELMKIEPGIVTIKIKEAEPLPAPIDLIAVPDDKNILLTWEYAMFKSIYNAYFVERSENGIDFKRLGGDTPLVNLNDKPGAPARRMFYVDTLSQNNKTFHYRVIGVSPFGEQGTPSEVVSAQGIKKLSSVPHISRHEFDNNGGVIINWDFAKETENEITGFELNWAAQEKGPYKVVKTGIPASSRKTTYAEPEPSNYFRVTALGKNNQKTTSLTAFVQTIDSIPPAAPIGLLGTVDTLGLVKLQWEANLEKDMLGYRVFRGNLDKEELSQITIDPINRTTFIDTVQVKSLNSSVFYQIVAVDKRFNMSDYSEKLRLKKPDVVPPSSPVFKGYKVDPKGIYLKWINSTSDDVVAHKLFRQRMDQSEKGWLPIFETDTITQYIDSSIESGIKYRYAIFAEDDSGLQSVPSTPITITSQTSTDEDLIKGFSLVADRVNKNISISWRKLPEDVLEITIYKSKKDEKPILFKQMPNSTNKVIDNSISPGNTYVYSLKVITKQGNHSKMKTKEVIF
ncbi:fibronectin type III domain-containing protein [Aquimarina algiphila]|uniref:fibronectin type III domain-containing protein n=1 Tax=Aquimarina algiphila TaxID=2047982 RepID=UPI00232CB4CE|nr:hypothetical protein [Aquimarina algiphila]